MTRLCVAIFVISEAQAARDVALAAEHGADCVELRVDAFIDGDGVARLLKASPIPVIITCRAEWEGGQCTLGEEDRLNFLRTVAAFNPSAIDVELRSIRANAASAPDAEPIIPDSIPTISSFHDFQSRPAKLTSIVQEQFENNAEISKIVWTARTIRDNIEAFEILRHRQKPAIVLCMGEHGLISRILAKKFNAYLTFAAMTKDSGTAPGQVAIADMKALYRWDAIMPSTKVYGVVASPVMHSMSPAIHNASFAAVGYDGVYLPMLVNAGYESFKAFMSTMLDFQPLDLSGLSVTLPHKENALRYLKEIGGEVEPLSEKIGAVNTIVIDRTNGLKLRGFNTDYAAILDCITSKMGITREQLSKYRVAVIGAGGTGRTAVAALAHYGATVVVYNRTMERAEELADEFNGHSGKVVAARMEKLCDSCCHIFINCTSVGMFPNIDASPLGDQAVHFSEDTVVFDTIYNPLQTQFLSLATEQGAKTIAGIEMFVRQAAAQFTAWTNQPAPMDLMRQVVERRLQG